MEEQVKNEEKELNPHKNRVHHILAHSYIFYFAFFIISLLLDFMFPFKLFEKNTVLPIGSIIIILGTALIFWAQEAAHKLRKEKEKNNLSKEAFFFGPYRYTRTPTHYGLLLLMLGFGVMINGLFIVISSIISFLITKFIFIKKQENILTEKYGSHYIEYKKSVKH